MKNIAVIVYDLTIEYNTTVLDGILSCLYSKEDVNVIISTVAYPHAENFDYNFQYWSMIELLKSKDVDAVINITNSFCDFISTKDLAHYLKQYSSKPFFSVTVPLKLVNEKYTVLSCKKAYVDLVEHMYKKHNRRRIAFMDASLTHSVDSEERFAAYKAALEKVGLPFDESLVYPGDFTPRTVGKVFGERFKTKEDIPFDAILCANDFMAAGCVTTLEALGVKIPEEVSIAGFDDSDIALQCFPSLTTINQNFGMTGYKTAEIAYRTLHGEELPKRNVIEVHPVYRQSCGCIDRSTRSYAYYDWKGKFFNEDIRQSNNNTLYSQKLNDLQTIYHFLEMMDSAITIESLFETLGNVLGKAHQSYLALCFYDEPITLYAKDDFKMPEKANLMMIFDKGRNLAQNFYDEGGIAFNPYKSIVPEKYKSKHRGSFFILPIFLRNLNYGYLVGKLERHEYTIFSIYQKIITNNVILAYEYTKSVRKQNKLMEATQELSVKSKTDELTQIFNRRGFMEFGQNLIDVSNNMDNSGAVFFCDLDGLKIINDTYGHEVGDLAIKTEAMVIKTALRESDLVGRLSGDEFAIVAPGFAIRKIDTFRERLKYYNKKFSKKYKLPFVLSISVGGVQYSAEDNDLSKLLAKADAELYEEKRIKHAINNLEKLKQPE